MSCSIFGCLRPLYVGSLCSAHYNRLRTTGTTDDGPRARASLDIRLWRSVERNGPDECWPWKAKRKIKGYGILSRAGRGSGAILAHRAAWELTNGPIPDGAGHHGTVVRHKCDNRLCCNPAHLEIGTQGQNVADMDAKGRRVTVTKRGSDHHNSRFTDADIRYIRRSSASNADLGREFKCARQVIGNIRNRKSWKHIK